MYLRVTPKGQKPGFRATLATFVTSAFWHGFYPGYYLAFVLASFVQTAAKNGRRMIRPLFMTPDGKEPLPTKKFYDWFTTVLTQIVFSFVVVPFILLGFSDTLTVWARVYFYALIGVAGSFVLFSRSLPFRSRLTQLQAARAPVPATIDKPQVEKAAREAIFGERLQKTTSQESVVSQRKGPILGIPDDTEAEMDEIVQEVMAEFNERRRRGSIMQGYDVKKAVQEKLKQFKKA